MLALFKPKDARGSLQNWRVGLQTVNPAIACRIQQWTQDKFMGGQRSRLDIVMPDGFGGEANKEVLLRVDEFPCFRHPLIVGRTKAALHEMLIVTKQPTGWFLRSRLLAARTRQLYNRVSALVPKKSEENLKVQICESSCRDAIEGVALGNLSRILVLE